jgi:iron complex transport system ATP-binding protein
MKDDIILRTDNLSVGYNKKIIVENIELNIEKGKIYTLIAPNGAGKSTILKSIANQLSLISGTVYIENDDIKNLNEKKIAKKISVLTTQRINTELMTCREVVETGRYPYTGKLGILSDEDKKIVDNAMQMVQIEAFESIDFNCISDGQRQRVLLAKAISQQPEILILDEPTSFLDVHHKLKLLSLLNKLVKKQELTVIMSLHELDLAQKISDIVICIKGNKIDRIGECDEIFNSYYINNLFDIENGSYNEYFGSTELEKIKGEPEIFIISGGRSGINTYRKLQREGIPFAVGVISENDIEYPIAKSLASKVISEKSFEIISIKSINIALEVMKKCKKVICCLEDFGTVNQNNKILYNYALENNMIIK